MKITIRCATILLIIIFCVSYGISVWAHSTILNIEYDDCNPSTDANGSIVKNDGEDEAWYYLDDGNTCEHISNSVLTIQYYFSDAAPNGINYRWDTDISEDEANAIKTAYANSMEKWNNVYYYTHDIDGNREPRKIISVIAGDEYNHNLIIYPANSTNISDMANIPAGANTTKIYAGTTYIDNGEALIETVNGVDHYHYYNWQMFVNIDNFIYPSFTYQIARTITGQHELGHVLGLRDVDNLCSANNLDEHHEEIIMGYGDFYDKVTFSTYKDIVGLAITRGFHTDADHRWMIRTKTDGSQYLICALCNGIRTNFSLVNGRYEGSVPVEYGSCNGAHNILNPNMLLVATNGEVDFYKCMCCRHIAKVGEDFHVFQIINVNTDTHTKLCSVCNKEVTEEHSFEYDENITGGHTKTCKTCDYSQWENHQSIYYDMDTYHFMECTLCWCFVQEDHYYNCTYVDAETHTDVCGDCGHEAVLEHSWEYTSNITGGHTKTCSDCGYSKSESHVYGYTCVNADTHKGICSLCGYESIEDHYFNCTYVDADTHSGVCRECGYAAVLEHSYEYKAIDSTYHILTCKCGATSGSSSKHIWTATSNENVVKCKKCARTKILAPGEIIPIIKTKPIIIEEESE